MSDFKQKIMAAAAFDHDAHTAIAHKILALCGPVYGPLDALMKAQYDENARLQPLLSALARVAEKCDEAADWLCAHEDASPTTGGRDWCAQCHNWVYAKDLGLRDRVRDALTSLRALCDGAGGGT